MPEAERDTPCGLHLFWDEAVTAYDFGPGHPMDPTRLALTMRLVETLGLDAGPGVTVRAAPPAASPPCGWCTPGSTWRRSSTPRPPRRVGPRHGLGTDDNWSFPAVHSASALIAGQSVAAAEAVWRGETPHAVNFAGGLHHAMPDKASGFCVYNDPALAVARLLELGAERVAYVDVDVHHGDGVQQAFWNDPRVLTISLHEHPATLFPQTGWPTETGGPDAPGTAANLPLPAGTGDAGWLRAFHAVVPELLAAFRPQVLVTQHGADTHLEDPLAHLAVTVDAQRLIAEELHDLAHRLTGGRWIATGGGGYAIVDVVRGPGPTWSPPPPDGPSTRPPRPPSPGAPRSTAAPANPPRCG